MFAWLMHIQNMLDSKAQIPYQQRGQALELGFVRSYPDSFNDLAVHLASASLQSHGASHRDHATALHQ